MTVRALSADGQGGTTPTNYTIRENADYAVNDFPVDAGAAATQRYVPETRRVAERLAG